MIVIDYAEKRLMARARMAARHEEREMGAAGFRRHETDWEIHRGFADGQIILEAKISADGLYVWTKVGWPNGIVRPGTPWPQELFQEVQRYGTAHPTVEQVEEKARG